MNGFVKKASYFLLFFFFTAYLHDFSHIFFIDTTVKTRGIDQDENKSGAQLSQPINHFQAEEECNCPITYNSVLVVHSLISQVKPDFYKEPSTQAFPNLFFKEIYRPPELS